MIKNKRYLNTLSGFTLIELLVVIAIIGILASVVISSVTVARSKAKDASVKSQLASMRGLSEVYYSVGQNYENMCTIESSEKGFGGSGGILEGIKNLEAVPSEVNIAGSPGSWNLITCNSIDTAWAVDAPLYGSIEGSPIMHCVDSTGVSMRKTTVLGAGDTACEVVAP